MAKFTTHEEVSVMYPAGTVLVLDERLNDPYSPKQPNDELTVSYVDAALQIHGTWKSGGSIALIYGLDRFHKRGEK